MGSKAPAVRALMGLEEAAAAADGDLAGRSEGTGFSSVVIDSRRAEAGALFVALPGERTDGHRFVVPALEAGCSAALVARSWVEDQGGAEKVLERFRQEQGGRQAALIGVDDPLAGLQALARAYREGFPDLITVGVTGSNGKTTTKEMIGSVLAEDAPAVVSRGNLNSEIGLPLSVFEIGPEHRYAVFEMGMNHPGEMEILADILRPRLGVITNIGTAHIGLLGSREGIAAEKKKIFSYFRGGCVGFIPEDSPYGKFLAQGVAGEIRPYGVRSTPGYKGWHDRGLDGMTVLLEDRSVKLPLYGSYNLKNALAAVSVGTELGVSADRIARGLEKVRPLFGRGRILRGDVTILEDCYNANPDSVYEALEFFDELPWKGRKTAVLGAMKELGRETETAHRALGRRLAESTAQAVFLAGPECAPAREAMEKAGYSGRIFAADTAEELRPDLEAYSRPEDLLLVKGSRGTALEKAVRNLC